MNNWSFRSSLISVVQRKQNMTFVPLESKQMIQKRSDFSIIGTVSGSKKAEIPLSQTFRKAAFISLSVSIHKFNQQIIDGRQAVDG